MPDIYSDLTINTMNEYKDNPPDSRAGCPICKTLLYRNQHAKIIEDKAKDSKGHQILGKFESEFLEIFKRIQGVVKIFFKSKGIIFNPSEKPHMSFTNKLVNLTIPECQDLANTIIKKEFKFFIISPSFIQYFTQ